MNPKILRTSNCVLSAAAFFFAFIFQVSAQIKPGFINRQATNVAGRQVLDPNLDGYTSATTAGFGAPSDVATSEIQYKAIPTYFKEPYGDLRRGPNSNYSDFVPDNGNDGFYVFFSGSNLLFRFRLGSVMSGSKGYSILMDTDGRFGATGSAADPNYQPATTGTNGNPGFEIEVVFESNFRIAVYNVDGTSSPVLVQQYTNWQDMSQVSVAATNDNGDPDFFLDFYIPFSVLQAAPFNLTASTPIRLIPTTVMSPQAAIGGPKSDIYGVSDSGFPNTNSQYEAYIQAQPQFSINNISVSGSGLGAICTAPPVINSPIGGGTVTISGTWTAAPLSGAGTTATITVLRNGTSVGTVPGVTSGGTWSLPNIIVVNGDIITARAQATGESLCLTSNSVTVLGCTPANTTPLSAAAFGVCVNNRRGMAGTKATNALIRIYQVTTSAITLFATDGSPASPSTFNISYGSPSAIANTTWEYNGANNSGSTDPCSGGPIDIPDGQYYITVTQPGLCESAPIWGSCVNTTATATPTITQDALFSGTVTVSGTAVSGALVRLFVNGFLRTTTTATGGNYTFSNVELQLNDVVEVRAQSGTLCISAPVTRNVSCQTFPPVINADGNGQIAAGQPISGASSDPAGTVIRIYNVTGPTLVATTSVVAGGSWTTASIPFNAVAGTTYYATAQRSGCGESVPTGNVIAATTTPGTRCGTITAPVTPGATSVSGTLTGSAAGTTVRLYLDGELIGSTTTSNTAWTITGIAATTIYANAVLSIGVQQTGSREVICPSTFTVACNPAPTIPTFTPTSGSIQANQTFTFTINNAVAGTFYGIADQITGQSLATGVWATANGNLELTTNPITQAGTYNVLIKATSINGVDVCTVTPAPVNLTVSGTLPVSLTHLSGQWLDRNAHLNWQTEWEQNSSRFIIERSSNGTTYEAVGTVAAAGNSANRRVYSYTDAKAKTGSNYYRLRMEDVDGRHTYSNIVTLRKGATLEVRSAPNPFQAAITIAMRSDRLQQVEVQLIDFNGRILQRRTLQAQPGDNNFKINTAAPLATGTYLLQVIEQGSGVHHTFKMQKQ